MPYGKGTYGSKVGRPPAKKNKNQKTKATKAKSAKSKSAGSSMGGRNISASKTVRSSKKSSTTGRLAAGSGR